MNTSPLPRTLKIAAIAVGLFLLSLAAYWAKCRAGVDLDSRHHLSGVEPYRTVWRLAQKHWPF